MLFQTSDTTWQAYNHYGGNSLYCGAPYSATPARPTAAGPRRQGELQPPVRYARSRAPELAVQRRVPDDALPRGERLQRQVLVRRRHRSLRRERRLIGLTSAKKPKIFLSVGHDEYWSGAQRTNVENARNAGVNLAFLSGNEVYWKTRWEPSIDGHAGRRTARWSSTRKRSRARRSIRCRTPIWTGTWRDTRFGPPNDGGRPENALIGIDLDRQLRHLRDHRARRRWRICACGATRASPQLTAGEPRPSASETLGYEWGEALENGFQPAGLVRLSSTTVANVEKIIDFGAHVGIGHGDAQPDALPSQQRRAGVRRQHRAVVVGPRSAITTAARPTSHPPDQAMQQATVNLFADMGAQPSSLQVGADPTRPLVDDRAIHRHLRADVDDHVPGAGRHGRERQPHHDHRHRHRQRRRHGRRRGSVGRRRRDLAQGDGHVDVVDSTGRRAPSARRRSALARSTTAATWRSPAPASPCRSSLGECPCTEPVEAVGDSRPTRARPTRGDVRARRQVPERHRRLHHRHPLLQGSRATPARTSATCGRRPARCWRPPPSPTRRATGWQQVNFGTPVADHGQHHLRRVVSHAQRRLRVRRRLLHDAGVDSPPLHAPPSGASRRQRRVQPQAAIAFPTSTFNAQQLLGGRRVRARRLEDVDAAGDLGRSRRRRSTARGRPCPGRPTSRPRRALDYGTDPAILTATLTSLPPGTMTVTRPVFVDAAQRGARRACRRIRPTTTWSRHRSRPATPPRWRRRASRCRVRRCATRPRPTSRAGTTTATYVSQTADGEVILAPTIGAEFTGPTCRAAGSRCPGAPKATRSHRRRHPAGRRRARRDLRDRRQRRVLPKRRRARRRRTFAAPQSLEFSANFSGDSFQHAGLGR